MADAGIEYKLSIGIIRKDIHAKQAGTTGNEKMQDLLSLQEALATRQSQH